MAQIAAGLGVLPWGPLGAGFLTGRYERGAQPPAGTRIGNPFGHAPGDSVLYDFQVLQHLRD